MKKKHKTFDTSLPPAHLGHQLTAPHILSSFLLHAMADASTATISFLDGSTVAISRTMTATEARLALTPSTKLYTHLDLCFQGAILLPEDAVGPRLLHGIWHKIQRLPLSESCFEDPEPVKSESTDV